MNKLTVFISSTMKDLVKERDAVEKVVTQLGAECLRAETYQAPGKSSYDVCMEMARACDIFIGIYGRRYGSHDPITGKSITEMEYEEAYKQRPRKILVFIKDTQSYEKRQKEFLRNILRFREGYFCNRRFSSVRQLKTYVREDLEVWIADMIHLVPKLEVENALLRLKIKAKEDVLQTVIRQYGLPLDIS
jgi:hypothetical protein